MTTALSQTQALSDTRVAPQAPAAARSVAVNDLVALTKPRITGMVAFTTWGGLWLASARGLSPIRGPLTTPLEFELTLWTLLGMVLLVSGANTLNCYLERDIDGLMRRTASRPLPAGRLDARVALLWGSVLSVASLLILERFVNPLVALLGAVSLVLYVGFYTPLKRISPIALWVGAVPGAMPPLMGAAAATGTIEAVGLTLFGILFFWQIPHFLAIALFRKDEYAAAGFKTLPVVAGDLATRARLPFYVMILMWVSLALWVLGACGTLYGVAALFFAAGFFVVSLFGLERNATLGSARTLFFASLVYLTGLFAALAVDAVVA